MLVGPVIRHREYHDLGFPSRTAMFPGLSSSSNASSASDLDPIPRHLESAPVNDRRTGPLVESKRLPSVREACARRPIIRLAAILVSVGVCWNAFPAPNPQPNPGFFQSNSQAQGTCFLRPGLGTSGAQTSGEWGRLHISRLNSRMRGYLSMKRGAKSHVQCHHVFPPYGCLPRDHLLAQRRNVYSLLEVTGPPGECHARSRND